MSPLIDMTGKKIGRLTVICREGTYQRPSGNKEPTWRCVCECGNEVVVHASNLKKRNTLSCGCLQGESRKEPRRETEYEVRGEVAYVKAFDGAEVVVNSCDLDYVLSHRWHLNGHGYAVDEHGITMHRALMFPPDCMDIHHINGNKLDNRRSNLLMLTRSEHTALHNGKNLANGVTVQRWIPVTERLPEVGADILVCHKNGFVTTNAWLGTHWWFKDDKNTITHWMPLPEPPKEGE